MDDYSQYQKEENINKPSMVFISKLQPCLKALNAEFLAIKDKVHHGQIDGLSELIQQWKSIESPENTRTKIQSLLIENYDELRFDVKVNMYKNHLGGITWIEQVIQRQFYFAKQHFNTQLNDFIKTGRLPLYPERKTDEANRANEKYLNSMVADFLHILKKLEETFASVYPAYIPTLVSNEEFNELMAYPTRIVLDYHSNDRIIEILHGIFNSRFISEIELADFKLHFTCDGFLPKLIWLNDDHVLYALFLDFIYGDSIHSPSKERIKTIGDPYLIIQNHFRKTDKEFTDKHKIQKNHKANNFYSIRDEDNRKIVEWLERINHA